jgi:hypothetical protein
MKKILFYKIFIFIFIFFMAIKTEAVIMSFETPKNRTSLNEEFYIDLLLDTEGDSINAIEGNIKSIGGGLSFIKAENGKSMMDLWVQKPEIINSSIVFAGISTNGFSGVIDPFNKNKKIPGLITRLFFKSNRAGEILFTTSDFTLNKNDGYGTEVIAPAISLSMVVNNQEYIEEENIEIQNDSLPQIEASIVQDINLYNNKHVLIFEAKDKENGIDKVLIKEGNKNWKEIKSPYLLKDQSRQSIIVLKAINHSGQSTLISIDGLPKVNNWTNYIEFIFVIVFIIFIIYIKRKLKK